MQHNFRLWLFKQLSNCSMKSMKQEQVKEAKYKVQKISEITIFRLKDKNRQKQKIVKINSNKKNIKKIHNIDD